MKDSKEKEHRISNLKDMINNIKEDPSSSSLEDVEEDSELIDYLNEHSEISQDLDNSNLGITKKGLPVIVDYSGFYSYRNF